MTFINESYKESYICWHVEVGTFGVSLLWVWSVYASPTGTLGTREKSQMCWHVEVGIFGLSLLWVWFVYASPTRTLGMREIY